MSGRLLVSRDGKSESESDGGGRLLVSRDGKSEGESESESESESGRLMFHGKER